jgi:beta-glucosidase-like glycosyl hydrolase
MNSRAHPQQGFRSVLGIMGLGKTYGEERLEAACQRALDIKARSLPASNPYSKTTSTKNLPSAEQPADAAHQSPQHQGQKLLRPKGRRCELMLSNPIMDKLTAMRLTGMAKALAEQMEMQDLNTLTFDERLGLMVDREMPSAKTDAWPPG